MLPHNHFLISGLAAILVAAFLSSEKPIVEWALISGLLSAAVDYDVYILVLLKSGKEDRLMPFRNPLKILVGKIFAVYRHQRQKGVFK